MFLGKKCMHYIMVYIVYHTELNFWICNYAQKRRICRENSKYALDKNSYGHLNPRRKPILIKARDFLNIFKYIEN